jgi:hypothetical protein
MPNEKQLQVSGYTFQRQRTRNFFRTHPKLEYCSLNLVIVMAALSGNLAETVFL